MCLHLHVSSTLMYSMVVMVSEEEVQWPGFSVYLKCWMSSKHIVVGKVLSCTSSSTRISIVVVVWTWLSLGVWNHKYRSLRIWQALLITLMRKFRFDLEPNLFSVLVVILYTCVWIVCEMYIRMHVRYTCRSCIIFTCVVSHWITQYFMSSNQFRQRRSNKRGA